MQVGSPECPARMKAALDVYRFRVDFSVDNSVPSLASFTQKLQAAIDQHAAFLEDESDQQTIADIRRMIVHAERDNLEAAKVRTE